VTCRKVNRYTVLDKARELLKAHDDRVARVREERIQWKMSQIKRFWFKPNRTYTREEAIAYFENMSFLDGAFREKYWTVSAFSKYEPSRLRELIVMAEYPGSHNTISLCIDDFNLLFGEK